MSERKRTARRVKEDLDLQVNLQDVINGLEDEVLLIDDAYRIRFANAAAQKGIKRGGSPVGQYCYAVLHGRDGPCGAPLWDCPLGRALQSGRSVSAVHPAPPGSDTYLKITAYPVLDRLTDTRAVVEIRRDVTAERELEAQILRRHHQLSALSHISRAASGPADLETTLRLALENVLEIIGGAMGGILLLDDKTNTLSYHIQRGLPAKYAETRKITLGEGITGTVAQTGEPIMVEDISLDPRAARPDVVRAAGIKGFVSIPLKAKDRVVGVMNIFSHVAGRFGADDVSLLSSIGEYLGTTIEQAKLYERLARVGERYRALLRYSLTAQEQERKRIASELHDETAQSLTSLTLSLQAIIGMAEMKGYNDPEFIEKLKKTHSYAVHAGNEIVRLMKELRPTLLDELGMAAAIHRYAKDNLQAQGINVDAEFTGTDQRFPSEVEVTLFRIAQGAIGNILEHSQAKNARIKLDCSDRECVLVIEDDGKGFNVSKLTRVERSGRGAGLFTMRERTSQLGGEGYVESTPGQGTRVTAKVPLQRTDLDEEDKGTDS
jgi:signal transduction histidine kinase